MLPTQIPLSPQRLEPMPGDARAMRRMLGDAVLTTLLHPCGINSLVREVVTARSAGARACRQALTDILGGDARDSSLRAGRRLSGSDASPRLDSAFCRVMTACTHASK